MNTQDSELILRDFQPGDEAAFRRLNEAWITRHFALEPKDEYTLAHPQESILDHGGRIFLAVLNGQPVGCCALIAIAPREFEVGKMTVDESARGAGIGRRMLEHSIAEAKNSGATRLYLETNHTLAPAIHLYEAMGFRHLHPASVVPSPYARADVYMELPLTVL
jgi:putative acetyltransferase